MSDSTGSLRMLTRSTAWSWMLTGCLLLGLGVATVMVSMALEQKRPAAARAEELAYLPQGKYLKIAVLGYEQIVADLLWMKAVQHFGTIEQTETGYRWAYHVVDVVTDLDPTFAYAYQAAGTVLGVWANLPHESIAIMEKGIRHNPEVWQLPFLLGYDYFYELCDTVTAAEYLRIAARLPGAPEYVPKLAARMTVEAGDPNAALEFLGRFYQQANDERIREAIALRMREVIAERDIRFLEEGVRRYQTRYQARPAALQDLVAGGIIPRIPEEPLEGAYVLRPDGTVFSTGLQERLKVHYKVGLQVGCQRFRRAPS